MIIVIIYLPADVEKIDFLHHPALNIMPPDLLQRRIGSLKAVDKGLKIWLGLWSVAWL